MDKYLLAYFFEQAQAWLMKNKINLLYIKFINYYKVSLMKLKLAKVKFLAVEFYMHGRNSGTGAFGKT